MKLSAKEVVKPAAILLAICVVVAAALGGTNLLTADRIREQAELKAEESRKLVLPEADAFTPVEEVPGLDVSGMYLGDSGGAVVGAVIETSAKGYGGDVKVMTGISVDGSVTGVVILSHGETPGLGANAVKEEFRDQFKQPVSEGNIEVVKYQTPSQGQIQAMTGATITSRAVTSAVNEAVEKYRALAGTPSLLAD